MTNKNWYLIYSKPRQEDKACAQLKNQGYEVYLPLVATQRRRDGRYCEVLEPMFPSYLFVALDPDNDNWSPIRSTIGVRELVKFGGNPAKIPASLVSELRDYEASGVQTKVVDRLKPGDEVHIVEGPMAGYNAIFEASTGNERVVLLLELASQYASLELSLNDINPL